MYINYQYNFTFALYRWLLYEVLILRTERCKINVSYLQFFFLYTEKAKLKHATRTNQSFSVQNSRNSYPKADFVKHKQNVCYVAISSKTLENAYMIMPRNVDLWKVTDI
jgi:hypothetical protein